MEHDTVPNDALLNLDPIYIHYQELSSKKSSKHQADLSLPVGGSEGYGVCSEHKFSSANPSYNRCGQGPELMTKDTTEFLGMNLQQHRACFVISLNYCHDLKQGLKYQVQKKSNTFQSFVAHQSGFLPDPNLILV